MYKLVKSLETNEVSSILKKEGNVTLSIPLDPNNTDYQKYLLWLEEGNEPLPPDPIVEPEPLTPQQKLEAAGLSIEELKELLGL